MLHPRPRLDQGAQHQLGTSRIGDVDGRQVNRQLSPIGVDGDVPLSSLDLLACIESAFASLRRGTGRLCIDYRRAWSARAPHARTPLFTQSVLHLHEYACTNPARKCFVDRLSRWERLK